MVKEDLIKLLQNKHDEVKKCYKENKEPILLGQEITYDYVIELVKKLTIPDVSGRSEQLCSCSSKILPNGNIQFSLCRKCQEEMNEHN